MTNEKKQIDLRVWKDFGPPKRKINVLAYIPKINDQCSFYRGAGPIGRLSDDFSVLYSQQFKKTDWHLLVGFDVFFILRPCTPEHFEMMTLAKGCGLKVIADYDDDFFNIQGHYLETLIGDQVHQKAIRNCMSLVHELWVSTPYLAHAYKDYADTRRVIPNAWDFKLFDPGLLKPKGPLVTWRGSETHDGDVADVGGYWISVANKYPEIENRFYWGEMKFVRFYMKNSTHYKFATIDYLHHLSRSGSRAMITPLEDIPFNHGKSNAAYLEAAACCMPTVAPSYLEEFQKPGVIGYKDGKEFTEALEYVMTADVTELDKLGNDAYSYVKESLSLEAMNLKREQLIKDMINEDSLRLR